MYGYNNHAIFRLRRNPGIFATLSDDLCWPLGCRGRMFLRDVPEEKR